MSATMKDLHALGLNPFAVQLLAESMLKSAYVKHCGTQPLTFNFPVQREDCASWLGVRITIEAVSAKEQPQAEAVPVCKTCKGEGGWEQAHSSTNYSWVKCADCTPQQAEAVPVDMVLYCPKCGVQHIDEPEDCPDSPGRCECRGPHWKNPPHKSHLCHGCGHIWRPSDMPTNGVKATASGKDADTAPQKAESAPDVVRDAERYRWLFSSHTEAELAECDQKSLQPPHTKQDETLALLGGWYATKEQADKAIDAAIAAQKASAQ